MDFFPSYLMRAKGKYYLMYGLEHQIFTLHKLANWIGTPGVGKPPFVHA